MGSKPVSPNTNLDLRVILEVSIRQFFGWLATILLVTFADYPGVVCVIPMRRCIIKPCLN